MNPELLRALTGADWKAAETELKRAATAYLTAHPDLKLSANELMAHLFPVERQKGEAGLAARRRAFKILRALARGDLKDWTECGPGVKIYGQARSLILWRKPDKRPCSFCGGTGFEA